ncbi:MAG: PPC domain-containing DNA-binding protein [Candidatus Zipacnadales bacterium]
MEYTQGQIGRVFAIRLRQGEPMPESLERFAMEKRVTCGLVVMVGGADTGSRLVVGPQDGTVFPPVPMVSRLEGVHEVVAVGTLFPDDEGRPVLHMHATLGRGNETRSGCIREGIVTWQVLEVVLLELLGLSAVRYLDQHTGFPLLKCISTDS